MWYVTNMNKDGGIYKAEEGRTARKYNGQSTTKLFNLSMQLQ